MSDHGHIDEQTFALLLKRMDTQDVNMERIETKIDAGFAKVNGGQQRQDDHLLEHDQWINQRKGVSSLTIWLIPTLISGIGLVAVLFLR